jgi:ADP-ribosylation factor-binding protein GGA
MIWTQLIHEWKNTICVTSKYKDDLVHIRDMHRLLSYKGYRFRSFDAVRAMQGTDITEVSGCRFLVRRE